MVNEPVVAVEQCRDGEVVRASLVDPERFADIFERHFTAIHRYLARRAGRVAADDLASQVFVVAFERRGSVQGEPASVLPWLYGIATNLLRNNARAERRRLAALPRLAGAAPAAASDLDGAEHAADRRRIAAALDTLDRQQRDILLLHAWEGLSYAEIATALDLPEGTVASRLSRARRRLRAALDHQADCNISLKEGS